jgi:hypothetical protein
MQAKTPTKPEVNKKPIDIESLRLRDREMVRGIFKFYEVPGGNLKFSFRYWKGDEVEHFDLNDGEIYTLPLGVARHLNKSGSYPIHAHAVDKDGKPVSRIGQKVRRYGFQSLEFIDDEDLQSHQNHIITVENI